MPNTGRYVSLSLLFASALSACGDDGGSGSATTSGSGGDDSTSAPSATASTASSSTPSSASSSGNGGGGSASTSDGGGGSTSDVGGGNTTTSVGTGGSGSGGSGTTVAGTGGAGGDPCAGDCFDTACNPGKACNVGNDGCGVCECDDPLVDIDPLTSLYIRDPAVLVRPEFEFSAVMQALVESAEAQGNMDARDLYVAWFDTNNDDVLGVANGIHCAPEINGFPVDCPRQEGELARRAVEEEGTAADPLSANHYKLVAIVHRFDKVPVDGANCGQYRFSYNLKDSAPPADLSDPDFNYLIFEGVLPNPRQDLGVAGCLPVAQYIASLGDAPDADARAALIRGFFFDGLPGFAPIIHWSRFVGEPSGGGQLRTNQFLISQRGQPWTAREYYLARSGSSPADYRLVVTPEAVKENAYGRLFSQAYVDDRKAPFQTWFVDEAVDLLNAATNVNDIVFPVPETFDAGQSTQPGLISGLPEEDLISNYVAQVAGNTTLLGAIQGKLDAIGSTLTPEQIVARAQQQSCAGCHQLTTSTSDLGGGLTYLGTGSLRFVHTVDYLAADGGYTMSDALTQQFLPRRIEILESYIQTQCALDVSSESAVVLPLPHGAKRAIGGGLASGH